MNAKRRKAIAALSAELSELKGKFDDLKSQLETIKDEEEEYRDNMPDSLRDGEKGEAAENAVNSLNDAYQYLEDIDNGLEETISALDEAKGE